MTDNMVHLIVLGIQVLVALILVPVGKGLIRIYDKMQTILEEIRDELRVLNGRLIKQETWAVDHEHRDDDRFRSMQSAIEMHIRRGEN